MIKKLIMLSVMAFALALLSLFFIPLGFTTEKLILVEFRLPRIFMAILAGLALSVSGAAIQSLLRNPLAEPGLIGISSWAALGGVLGLYFLPSSFLWLRPLGAMALALLSLCLLFLLAGRRATSLLVILAGIASTSFAAACISLFLNLAPNPWVLGEMMEWMMGSFKHAHMHHIFLILPFLLLGLILLFSCRRSLDILSLGEYVAASQGVNLPWLYWRLNLGIALAVGSITAFCGIIGFVGLIIPHIVRPWAGHRPSHVMFLSAPLGIIFMLMADGLIQLIPTRSELYMGVIMAFLGFPLFIHLLIKQKREGS